MDFNKFFTSVKEVGDMRLILKTCLKEGALRNQAAYLLATAKWETNHTFRPVEEAYWLSEGWRKRNLRYYPWHGRGYVQMTWRRNYVRAETQTGIPFSQDPTLAMVPKHAAKLLVKGTLEGWWTGKRLGTYVNLHRSNFKGARRCINGTDKDMEIAQIASMYDDALLDAGYGVTGPKNAPQESIKDPSAGVVPETPSKPSVASKSLLATFVEVAAKTLVEYLRKK